VLAGKPMELIPGSGFGNILLGMERNHVCTILGEPDSVEVHDDPTTPGATYTWVYERLGAELAFDREADFKLARITILNPLAVLLGSRPIGLSESELSRTYPNAKLDLTAGDMKDFVDSDINVSFWTQAGKVVHVTLYPNYDESGNVPQWPKAR
jgi:hypothetical protein